MTLAQNKIRALVRLALREDAAFHDVTTRALIPKKTRGNAFLLAKQNLMLCGMPMVREVFRQMDPKIRLQVHFKEGERVKRGQTIATLSGPLQGLLSGERVALNFLQRLSGIATLTQKYVDVVRGTRVRILDTRKTTPGLRALERIAVSMGGGYNHRFDLKSGAMAKDNHLAALGSLRELCHRLQPLAKKVPVVVEVKNLRQFREALKLGAPWIQLDNMSLSQMRLAVKLAGGDCRLEATGGMTLDRVAAVARTGVDFISVGALTHSAPAVDISLEFKS